VVLPAPYYFNHQMWLDMLGVEKRLVPAFADDRAYPLPEEMASLIDGSTRAIILCSPNNPTGAIYPPHVIENYYELAKASGIALIIDETYKDFRSSPEPLHDLFATPDWHDTFVQLYSFSKVFAMTGYRAGSIIAGNKVLAEAEKILDCMAICAPQISQRAALFGLAHLDDWKRNKQRLMEARREALLGAFTNPRLSYKLISSGAYFAYVKHPFEKATAKSVAMRLAGEHDVLCLPGSMFGPGQDSYLRLAFANSPAEDMPLLVERLIESQT
jgi:aspartate/methionine/tyrosine aminotransferase